MCNIAEAFTPFGSSILLAGFFVGERSFAGLMGSPFVKAVLLQYCSPGPENLCMLFRVLAYDRFRSWVLWGIEAFYMLC
jgi:hypothetical protein